MDPVLRRYLLSLQAAGVRRIPRGSTAIEAPASEGPAADRAAASGALAAAPANGPAPGAEPEAAPSSGLQATLDALVRPPQVADPERALAQVAAEVSDCTRCKLCKGRTQAVPGEGNPRARIVFIGEGPGADEDRTGRPFVGRAGQLLDDIITKGMKMRREDVFIGNVVKCRPPGNRAPEPDEVAACAGFLERQIDALSPAVICALGNTAAHLLLDTGMAMSRLRGGTYHFRGIPVIPTYHPAYLLRNPAAKRPTWEDIQRVMELART